MRSACKYMGARTWSGDWYQQSSLATRETGAAYNYLASYMYTCMVPSHPCDVATGGAAQPVRSAGIGEGTCSGFSPEAAADAYGFCDGGEEDESFG